MELFWIVLGAIYIVYKGIKGGDAEWVVIPAGILVFVVGFIAESLLVGVLTLLLFSILMLAFVFSKQKDEQIELDKQDEQKLTEKHIEKLKNSPYSPYRHGNYSAHECYEWLCKTETVALEKLTPLEFDEKLGIPLSQLPMDEDRPHDYIWQKKVAVAVILDRDNLTYRDQITSLSVNPYCNHFQTLKRIIEQHESRINSLKEDMIEHGYFVEDALIRRLVNNKNSAYYSVDYSPESCYRALCRSESEKLLHLDRFKMDDLLGFPASKIPLDISLPLSEAQQKKIFLIKDFILKKRGLRYYDFFVNGTESNRKKYQLDNDYTTKFDWECSKHLLAPVLKGFYARSKLEGAMMAHGYRVDRDILKKLIDDKNSPYHDTSKGVEDYYNWLCETETRSRYNYPLGLSRELQVSLGSLPQIRGTPNEREELAYFCTDYILRKKGLRFRHPTIRLYTTASSPKGQQVIAKIEEKTNGLKGIDGNYLHIPNPFETDHEQQPNVAQKSLSNQAASDLVVEFESAGYRVKESELQLLINDTESPYYYHSLSIEKCYTWLCKQKTKKLLLAKNSKISKELGADITSITLCANEGKRAEEWRKILCVEYILRQNGLRYIPPKKRKYRLSSVSPAYKEAFDTYIKTLTFTNNNDMRQ